MRTQPSLIILPQVIFLLAVPGLTSRVAAEGIVDLKPGRETTWFTAPVREDGRVDYPSAINAYWKPDRYVAHNNAVGGIAKVFGPDFLAKTVRSRTLEELGVDSLPAKRPRGDYFRPSTNKSEVFDQQLAKAVTTIWTPQNLPLVSRWMTHNTFPLLEMQKAVGHRDEFYRPVYLPEGKHLLRDAPIPEVDLYVHCSHALAAKTTAFFQWRDNKKALRYLRAAFKLARLAGNSPTPRERRAAWKCERIASRALFPAIEAGMLEGKEAKELRQWLDDIPARGSVAGAFDTYTRCVLLDIVAASAMDDGKTFDQAILAATDPNADAPLPIAEKKEWAVKEMNGAAFDINRILAVCNRWLDAEAKALKADTPHLARRTQLALRKQLTKAAAVQKKFIESPQFTLSLRQSRFNHAARRAVADAVAICLLQALWTWEPGLADSHAEAQAHTEVVRTALAIAAYKGIIKRMPTKPTDVVTGFLPKWPKDPYTGGDLKVRAVEGGYCVYSVGPNRKDEKGNHEPDRKDGADDISITVK
ncbi:MAG: hypothetical protein ACLFVU_14910 [Phycisphaerae bacterium]